MAKKKKTPIDPALGSRFVLDGRAVTMNNAHHVIERSRIYISEGTIQAVREADAPVPDGFDTAPVIKTGGTVFPGLIELHNHLSYNALPLWQVPRIFAHRGQWSNHPDKRRLISQPMSVLASISGLIEALVRYVEAKCLVAGVTTSQGLTLVAAPGIEHRYRGIVRNVERTDDETLPQALTRIADVENATDFLKRLRGAEKASLLLHLAEGIGDGARQHFLRLQLPDQKWAITPSLIGIHGAGLLADDLEVLAEHGGSVVWSPLSNLLLYGGTADVKRAKAAGVTLALGSDWSPSGSKNLLSELKVARAWSDQLGGIFTARELVAMATINPARMLKWDEAVGSIAPGKRADLLVVRGRTGDPYEKLLKALEDDIELVLINGVPRFGKSTLMDRATANILGDPLPKLESRKLGGRVTKFNFVQDTADPLVAPVTLAEAEKRLSEALRDLPNLASGLADPLIASSLLGIVAAEGSGEPTRRWTLALDNEPHEASPFVGESIRPLAPFEPDSSLFGGDALALNASLAANLVSMSLDRLTVVEDESYFDRLAKQINLSEDLKRAIPKLHGAPVPTAPIGKTVRIPPVADSPEQASDPLPRSLNELMALKDMLTDEDRIQLVRQLRTVLEDVYVHLPLKRAAHAVDPLQSLKLLQYSLEERGPASPLQGLAFHARLLEIFTSLRDLHTVYILPEPYNQLTAFLPFLIERCFDCDEKTQRPVYLVTKVADSLAHPTFRPGVELLYWNGMPIENAIRLNAQRQAGSNSAARFARGLASMTIRPLMRVLPPEEEWALLTYRSLDHRVLEIRLPWQIRSPIGSVAFDMLPLSTRADGGATGDESRGRKGIRDRQPDTGALASFGVDVQMEAVNAARRDLYARPAPKRTRRRASRTLAAGEEIASSLPGVLRARAVKTPDGIFGHLRIYTFSVPDADAFVAEVIRILKQLPKQGLILDVRNNGGGLIWAAEQLLQLFTDQPIQPERAQFLVSPRMLDLVRRHAPSALSPNLNFKPWLDSMSRAVITAAVYSEGFTITPVERANKLGRQYRGPVLLITDALAYSATDMFAAGFKDHHIGPIIGVDDNTGAGGANVWPYALLQELLRDKEPRLPPLPGGCDLRIAVRRTLRVGDSAGMPLEDLGVVPDARHYLTRRDVLEQNQDLIENAAKLLKRRH